MKKILFSIMALIATSMQCLGQNALSVADITLPQNSEVTLTVSFQVDAADTYTGYSFNLELPSELQFVMDEGTDVACTKGECHDASHSVTANLDNGIVKVAGLSLSSKPLKGTSGVLLTFTIKPTATFAVGTTFTGTIRDILIVPVEGTKQNLEAGTFTVTIGEPADTRTILDETSTVMPKAATGVDVRVRRTITAGNWSTICLPFAMNANQVKAAFGEDTQLADFDGYEAGTDDDDNVVAISVKFKNATAIEANHPYLIKVTQDVSGFTVDGVDIDPEEEPTVAAIKRTKKQWSEMIGTYVPKTIDSQMLFLNGNKFWYSAGKTQMKGYRAYFDFYDVLTAVEEAGARISMNFTDETTGISLTPSLSLRGEGSIYTLDGRQIQRSTLRKGIYVKQGKKMIVK